MRYFAVVIDSDTPPNWRPQPPHLSRKTVPSRRSVAERRSARQQDEIRIQRRRCAQTMHRPLGIHTLTTEIEESHGDRPSIVEAIHSAPASSTGPDSKGGPDAARPHGGGGVRRGGGRARLGAPTATVWTSSAGRPSVGRSPYADAAPQRPGGPRSRPRPRPRNLDQLTPARPPRRRPSQSLRTPGAARATRRLL